MDEWKDGKIQFSPQFLLLLFSSLALCIAFISYYIVLKSDFVKWKDLLSLITAVLGSLTLPSACRCRSHNSTANFSTTLCFLQRIKVWMAINLSPEFPTRLRRRRRLSSSFSPKRYNVCDKQNTLLWNEININMPSYFQLSLGDDKKRKKKS